jgi:hypothetical protein
MARLTDSAIPRRKMRSIDSRLAAWTIYRVNFDLIFRTGTAQTHGALELADKRHHRDPRKLAGCTGRITRGGAPMAVSPCGKRQPRCVRKASRPVEHPNRFPPEIEEGKQEFFFFFLFPRRGGAGKRLGRSVFYGVGMDGWLGRRRAAPAADRTSAGWLYRIVELGGWSYPLRSWRWSYPLRSRGSTNWLWNPGGNPNELLASAAIVRLPQSEPRPANACTAERDNLARLSRHPFHLHAVLADRHSPDIKPAQLRGLFSRFLINAQ